LLNVLGQIAIDWGIILKKSSVCPHGMSRASNIYFYGYRKTELADQKRKNIL
jgi:hypothetical protein